MKIFTICDKRSGKVINSPFQAIFCATSTDDALRSLYFKLCDMKRKGETHDWLISPESYILYEIADIDEEQINEYSVVKSLANTYKDFLKQEKKYKSLDVLEKEVNESLKDKNK